MTRVSSWAPDEGATRQPLGCHRPPFPTHPYFLSLSTLLGGRPGGGGGRPGIRRASPYARQVPTLPTPGEITRAEKLPATAKNSVPSRFIKFASLSFCHPGGAFAALEETTYAAFFFFLICFSETQMKVLARSPGGLGCVGEESKFSRGLLP